MGRWSQYRHRGRGENAAAPGFPLSPPVSGNWELTQVGSELLVSMLAGCPLGADGVRARGRISPDSSWPAVAAPDCGGEDTLSSDLVPDDLWQAEVAWTNAGDLVSDWSAMKSVVIV